jgi:hypothetical protein
VRAASGDLPSGSTVPLEYRLALDSAMPFLTSSGTPRVICHGAWLETEVHLRVSIPTTNGVGGVLWVEPQAESFGTELAALSKGLLAGARVAVVASRPLARLLPECRRWGGNPLGYRPFGIGKLRAGLERSGFKVESNYGIHSVSAIAINLLGGVCERLGKSAVADRLHFSARLHYLTTGPLAMLTTTALLLATKR